MEHFQLTVASRTPEGSRAAGRLRQAGIIPGIVYRKHTPARALSIEESVLKALLRRIGTSLAIVELDYEGQKALALIQEVKRHATTDRLLHVDFHEIAVDEPITLLVPIHLSGEAPGVAVEHGSLNLMVNALNVKAPPKDLPNSILVDISKLHVSQAIHIKDLAPLEGVQFLGLPEQVIVSISAPVVQEVAPAETPAAKKTTTKKAKK